MISSSQAADLLRTGQIVAIPTETVYGLAASALDEKAVAKIFAAKGRPADNPLIVHVVKEDVTTPVGTTLGLSLQNVAREVPPAAQKLIAAFWPGPLTLVFKKTDAVPDIVTGGLDTVAVRMPSHPVAREIIRLAGVPLAAPSANKSGRPSPTTAAHVVEDFGDTVPVVDGGPCAVGVESTVVDVTQDPPVILREGAVTAEEIEKVLGVVVTGRGGQLTAITGAPRSPGMKYRHYAPDAKLRLIPYGERAAADLWQHAEQYLHAGDIVGVVATENYRSGVDSLVPRYGPGRLFFFSLGDPGDAAQAAQRLYGALREADRVGVEVILAVGISEKGVGAAVMERLRKATEG